MSIYVPSAGHGAAIEEIKVMKAFTVSKLPACNRKKEWIVHLIDEGLPRPDAKSGSAKERRAALSLWGYLNPKVRCYDPLLADYIRTKRPDWLVSYRPQMAKQRILAAKKPAYVRKSNVLPNIDLMYLNRFTNPKSNEYDAELTEEIKKKAYWWLPSKDRDIHSLLDLEKFFFEYRRFPCAVRTSYANGSIEERREGYLYYWLREISKKDEKRLAALRKKLKSTRLPQNLFAFDKKFFNRFMSRLREVEIFYNKFGRLPRGKYFSRLGENKQSALYERDLGAWIRSRSKAPSFRKWLKVARPLIEAAGLPEDTFGPV